MVCVISLIQPLTHFTSRWWVLSSSSRALCTLVECSITVHCHQPCCGSPCLSVFRGYVHSSMYVYVALLKLWHLSHMGRISHHAPYWQPASCLVHPACLWHLRHYPDLLLCGRVNWMRLTPSRIATIPTCQKTSNSLHCSTMMMAVIWIALTMCGMCVACKFWNYPVPSICSLHTLHWFKLHLHYGGSRVNFES